MGGVTLLTSQSESGVHHLEGLDASINIGLIATSEIRTSCVVAEDAGVKALQVVHTGFGLGGEERHTAQGTASPHDPD